MASNPNPKTVVVLIHGTFASFDEDRAQANDNGRFWQHGSRFAVELQQQLGDSFLVAPIENPRGIFHWSGANSEEACRATGTLLLKTLYELEKSETPYVIVAHSHGGGALWRALCEATWNARYSTAKVLPHLKGWITVGTPYMQFIPDFVLTFSALVIFVSTLGVIVRQRLWVLDFWNNALIELPYPQWLKAVLIPLFYLGAVLGIALGAFVTYRLFALAHAQRDPRPTSAIPRVELKQARNAVVLTIQFIIIWTLAMFLVPGFREITYHSLKSSSLVGSSAFSILGVLSLLISGGLASWPIVLLRRCHEEAALARRSWDELGRRYTCIADQRLDEAINGLKLILGGIEGPLLPRIPAPGANHFTQNSGWPMRPELEMVRDTLLNRLLGVVVLPILIIRDWVIRPIYNEVFAELVDAYVLRQLSRQAHGADIIGLRIGAVRTTPIPVHSQQAEFQCRLRDRLLNWINRKHSMTDSDDFRWAGPNEQISTQLRNSTADNAGPFLDEIRNALGTQTSASASLKHFVQQAMQGKKGAMDLLVHTSYFDDIGIVGLIANRIVDPEGVGHKCTVVPESAAGPSDFWPPKGFFWGILRVLVTVLVLCIPAFVLSELGLFFLYPTSREARLVWAAEPERAISEAARTATQINSESRENSTPPFVRWWAASKALDRRESNNFDALIPTLIEDEVGRTAIRANTAEKLAELGCPEESRAFFTQVEQELTGITIESSQEMDIRLVRKAFDLAQTSIPDLAELNAPTIRAIECKITERSADNRSAAIRELWHYEQDLRKAISDGLSLDQKKLASLRKLIETSCSVSACTTMDEAFNVVQPVIAIEFRLSQLGNEDESRRVLQLLRAFNESLSQTKQFEKKRAHIVALHVLTAKAHRLFADLRPLARDLLRQAETIASRETKPSQRLMLYAKIAAGYARLGLYEDELRLSKAAAPREQLDIALQVLASELEMQLPASFSNSERADTMMRINVAIDEQTDSSRHVTPVD